MKLKYIISLVIILAVTFFISRKSTIREDNAEVETENVVTAEKPTAAVETITETAVESSDKVDDKVETKIEVKVEAKTDNTLKKKDGPSQKEITRKTEEEFLSMTIPSSFSNVEEIRYQEIYSIYQKSTFYLNEVAAGHLDTNKENLVKAFKGLTTYFKENNVTEQTDSALLIINEEKAYLFEEALKALPKKDRALIKAALKLQEKSE